jgi:hypothetical protein
MFFFFLLWHILFFLFFFSVQNVSTVAACYCNWASCRRRVAFFFSFRLPGSVLNVSSSSCLLSQLSLSFLSILNILTSMSSRIVYLIENEVIIECRSADQASEDLAAERCMCSQFFRGRSFINCSW